MRRVGVVVAGLTAAVLGCGGGWERHGGLPANLQVSAVLVLRPDRVVVTGHAAPGGGQGPITAREPRIYAFDGGPASLSWGEGTGWIVAAGHRDGEVWAVRAQLRPEGEGSLYDLLASDDGGVSWERRGPIPADSLATIVVAGGGAGWAHGAGNLWRTEDGGATWAAVVAPGARSAASECLVALGPRTALLGGDGLFRTDDGGASWRALSSEAIAATDGRYVAGPTAGGLRIGRLEAAGVRWGATYGEELRAAHVASDGDRVTVVAVPIGERAGRGLVRLHSGDGGATLEEAIVSGPANRAFVALHGPDGLALVDQGRTLRLRGFR